jgi:hypothetical protein
MWADTGISEEHTISIFRVEMNRFRNWLGYVIRLQGRWGEHPKEGGMRETQSKRIGKMGGKMIILRGTFSFASLVGNGPTSEQSLP